MRETTDLKEIKKLARLFLMLDVKETEFSPMVVKHPFTDSGIVAYPGANGEIAMGDITKEPEILENWRKEMTRQIKEARSAHAIAYMITKSYSLAFLKYAAAYLSRKDFSEMLADMWVRTEAPNSDVNLSKSKLVALFKKADPKFLMTEEEYEVFKNLDDTVIVYRGVTSHNACNVRALSWTLDFETADWFAHRFNEAGTVYEARIDRSRVYAYFGSRNEAEVIVDPEYLFDIMETDVMDHYIHYRA